MYDILNYDIIAIFFPTNESIFQHMRMIMIAFIFYYLILYIIRKKAEINNIFLSLLISSCVTIIFFLAIYLPIYFKYGENMIFTFILLFVSIMLGQTMSYNFLRKENSNILNIISIILIIVIWIIGVYHTFYPLHNRYFWDSEHKTYERVIKQ